MAVIIEEMKMPENCGSCDFNHGYRCTRTKTVIDRDFEYQERLSDCPLHEVKTGQWIVLDDIEKVLEKYIAIGEKYEIEEETITEILKKLQEEMNE